MSDPFRKWAQGDEWEVSAAQLNAWTDAARFAQQSLGRPTAGDGQLFQPFTPMRMYNNTGAAIPQLGVVTYTTPMILPSSNENRFINEPTLVAIKPAAPLDRFAIALSRVEISGVFWGVCGGVVPCKITGTGSKAQAIINDVNKLQAGESGYELIWKESGAGTRFGIVKLFGTGGCGRKYQIFVLGNPLSGSFVLPVRAQQKDPETGVRSGAYYTEDITIPYNASVAQTRDAIEGHTYIDAGEITAAGSLTLLSSPHTITLPEGVDFGVGTGTIDSSGLVRRGLEIPRAYLSECCT